MSAPWVAAFVGLALVVVAQAVVTLGIVRKLMPLIERVGEPVGPGMDLGGLPLLSRVPQLNLRDANGGGEVSFPATVDETSIVLLVESGCAPCATLAGVLRREQALEDALPIITISDVDAVAKFRFPEWVTSLVGDRQQIVSAFETSATPYGFVITADGVVLEHGAVNDRRDIESMTHNQRGGAQHRHTAVTS